MKRRKIRTATVLSALMLAAGCEKKQETPASAGRVEKLKQEAKDAVTTAAAYLIQQRDQLQKSLADKMADFDKQLSEFRARSEQAGDQARSGWTNTLTRLQRKKQVAADKLAQLRNSSVDRWQELKTGAEAAFADLEKALKEAFGSSKDDDKSGKP